MPEAALALVSPERGDRALARLCGLAVSTPSTSFTQDELLPLLGLAADPFAEGIFARSGVRKRHLELSSDTLPPRSRRAPKRPTSRSFVWPSTQPNS